MQSEFNTRDQACFQCGARLRPWQWNFCSEACYEAGQEDRFITRFWNLVDKNGPTPPHNPSLGPCWVWLNKPVPAGYGQFSIWGKNIYAHRIAYRLTYGALPEGLVVRHQCHNRRCVRPDHLLAGTQMENIHDGIRDGRFRGFESGERHWSRTAPETIRRGDRHHMARLTAADVTEIRRIHAESGTNATELARIYGVHRVTVRDVIHRITWRHIP
jgi:hypothetical protein